MFARMAAPSRMELLLHSSRKKERRRRRRPRLRSDMGGSAEPEQASLLHPAERQRADPHQATRTKPFRLPAVEDR